MYPPEAPPENLHRIIDAVRVGIIQFALDGRAVYVNRHWRELTGCDDPCPISPGRLAALTPPDDRRQAIEDWTKAIAGSEGFDFVNRFLVGDGRLRPIQGHAEPIFDETGTVTGFVGTVVDVGITLEDTALDPNARYRLMHQQAAVGMVVTHLDGTIVEVNDAFAAIMRTTPAQIVGRYPWDIFHTDDLPRVMAQLANLTEGRAEFVADEVRAVRADGSIAWLVGAATIVRGPDGTETHIHATLLDITGRHETQDLLQASEARYRAVIDALQEGILILTADGGIQAINDSAAAMLGISVDDDLSVDSIAYMADWRFVDAWGRPIDLDDLPTLRALRTGQPESDRVIGFDRPDQLVWLRVNVRPLPGPTPDAPGGVVVSLRNITEEKSALDALLDSEARYRGLVETAPLGQMLTDLEGNVLEVNAAYAELVGGTPHELVGHRPFDRIHRDDLLRVRDELGRLLEDELETFDIEYRALRLDGEAIWVRGPVSLVRGPDGTPSMVHGFVQNIHEERAAIDQANRLAGIVESTSDVVGMLLPETGCLVYLNRSGRQLFGIGDDDISRLDIRDLFIDESAVRWETDIAVAMEMGRTWSGQLDMRRAAGDVIHLLMSIGADYDERGSIRQINFVGRDVTEQRRHEIELAHQATHDPLTDLPNRALLLELIEHALARSRRDGSLVALLFLDLDRFKTVNDNLGHDAGDELLIEVASRIRPVLRPSDTLARLGGDEFVVLCEEVRDEHQVVAITQRITSAIQSQPFAIGTASLPVTASVGIALSTDENAHPEGLLRDADAAMYRAKDRGRARLELFDENMRRRSARRLELADELASAIEHGQIVVHYQPIIDLTSGHVTAVEALARWEHPTRGTLPPWEFIGLAEETGLIVGLGLSVLSQACDQTRRWDVELGRRAPRVHVNLSARQLAHSNLPRLVQGVIDQSLIDADRLCLEVTESVLMEDAATSVQALEELKSLGVELAIDDFGTGYSSLAYLRRFPVDVLKIDRSFVDGLGPDPDDSAIVSVIVGLADTMGLACIAEGVETAEQLAGLQGLGCGAAQGFYFARPQPVREVGRYLSTIFHVDDDMPHPDRSRRRRAWYT